MSARLTENRWLLLVLAAAAFWPVWPWYLARMTDGSDEPWGVVALVTLLGVLLAARPAPTSRPVRLALPAAFALAYAASYGLLPPLLRAAVAMLSLGCLISESFFGRRFHWGVTGLLLLSLPVMSSLQFCFGYPLRALVARGAAELLQAVGFAVQTQGAALAFGNQVLAVDAPCSGLRMLWTSLFLVAALGCLLDLDNRAVVLGGLAAVVSAILGNVLRATSLFFPEAGLVDLPCWAHAGLGLAAFALAAGVLAWLMCRKGGGLRCVPDTSA